MPSASFEQAYPLAVRAAQVRAAAAVVSGAIPPSGREDLEQEGLAACWRALPQFDPTRACLRTFLERVAAARMISLHRARRCRPRLQPLGHNQYRAADGWDRQIECRADVQRALGTLNDADRRLAGVLMEHTVAEASRLLGIGRSTAYEHIRHIRVVFQAAGLGPRGVAQ